MNPPNIVDIELTPEEVQRDLVEIVKTMNKMRVESIKNKLINKKIQDEYLHLTYRLASCIEAIANEELTDSMQKIIDLMNAEKQLMTYDPLQEGYWNKQIKTKEFSQRLEVILMGLMNEQFCSTEEKHHILQAIKYLAVRNSEEKDVEEVRNTLLPFHKAISLSQKNHNFIQRILGKLFGRDYEIAQKDDLTLVDEGFSSFIEALVQEALDRGFAAVNYKLLYKYYRPLESKLQGYLRNTIDCEIINWQGRKIGNETAVELEVQLRPEQKPPNTLNTTKIYESIIKSETSPEIIASYPFLNAMGKFTEEEKNFFKSLGLTEENYYQFKMSTDKQLKEFYIHNETKINPKQKNCLGIEVPGTEYTRLHTLLFKKEESFVVYATTTNQPTQYKEKTSKILAENKSLKEKTKMLGLQFNAAHVIIKKYIKGKEVDSAEYLHAGGILK